MCSLNTGFDETVVCVIVIELCYCSGLCDSVTGVFELWREEVRNNLGANREVIDLMKNLRISISKDLFLHLYVLQRKIIY